MQRTKFESHMRIPRRPEVGGHIVKTVFQKGTLDHILKLVNRKKKESFLKDDDKTESVKGIVGQLGVTLSKLHPDLKDFQRRKSFRIVRNMKRIISTVSHSQPPQDDNSKYLQNKREKLKKIQEEFKKGFIHKLGSEEGKGDFEKHKKNWER
jgi:hypothetical protein